MRKIALTLAVMAVVSTVAIAQGSFFGGIQVNNDYYIRDSLVGAANTPHYDNLKSSADIWVDLKYRNQKYDFDAGIRLDLFLNSNLHNPGNVYNKQGIGMWYIRKRFDKFEITGGYIYDQFGSGIIFRAYEDRTLGIDNAVLGGHIKYDVLDNLTLKAFAGVQKNRIGLYKPVIMGFNAEGFYTLGKEDKLQLIPGVSVVNRTIDQESMDNIVNTIKTYDEENRFVPRYNAYAFGAYNTLNIGPFGWYVEYAYKTHEAQADQNLRLFDSWGQVIYTTMTFTVKGLGISGQYKRTENFQFRTSPNETLLQGMISYIPPVTRQNSLRLPARYAPQSLELEEQGYGFDVTYTPVRKVTLNGNFSEVRTFDNFLRYREVFFDADYRINRSWKMHLGLQFMQYDQDFYQREKFGDYTYITAYTPFIELLWKINRKHSLRLEVQNQFTDEDFGAWAFGLLEYNISPWFSLAVTDMWNYDPNPNRVDDDLHYYSVLAAFNYGTQRLSVAYVRQVEGIVCTGGICRLEPAFNGVRLSFTSTF